MTSTTSATSFAEEKLAALPNARDFWTILAAAPAIQLTRIDVAGSAAGTQTAYSAYDTKADQHRPMVEGIVNTEGTNAAGFYYDYGSVDEVAINAGGNTAEMPWPGVWSNFVAKSGGNTYHGKLYADYQNGDIQSSNIPDTLTAHLPGRPLRQPAAVRPQSDGVLPRCQRRHRRLHEEGQAVVVFLGARPEHQVAAAELPGEGVRDEPAQPDRQGDLRADPEQQADGVRAGRQEAAAESPGHLPRRPRWWPGTRRESSTWRQEYWGHTYKAGWDSVVNDKMFFEVRGGQFKYEWPNFRQTEEPAFQDIGNNLVRGGNRDGWFNIPSRNQVLGSLSYFKDGWGGSHNFKVGGEWFRETFTYIRGAEGKGFVPGDVLHILNNGAPLEV